MKFLILITFFSGFCCYGIIVNKNIAAPRVNTPLGWIEGVYNASSEGRLFEAYEGIPYAEPPIGDLRFEIPKPISPWTGVLMAKKPGSVCVQWSSKNGRTISNFFGSEDCLFLNVYVPNTNLKGLLPVIFFIHGGGLAWGAGSNYGPKYLLNRNVILVTINYRLGPLGFLSTEDEIVPGNMGLKDQIIALRWVNENIKFFGGDPSSITIVGHSRGGACVQYFYMTNTTSGLFQRGMSISGTSLIAPFQAQDSLRKAKKVAALIGCPTTNIAAMVYCLKSKPAMEIAQTINEFLGFELSPPAVFSLVVEKGNGNFKVIDRPPIESLSAGHVHDLPWIASNVAEEGLIVTGAFMNDDSELKQVDVNFEEIAPHMLAYNYTIPEGEKFGVSRLIRRHYLGRKRIDQSTVQFVTQMNNDRRFLYDNEKAVRLQARASRSPVRFYYMTYRGAHSYTEKITGNNINYGICHSDDIAYVLDSWFDPTTTQRDREMQKKLIDIWVSFATTGTPDVGVEWPRLDPCRTEFRYLEIDAPNEIYMNGTMNYGDREFWNTINFQENILSPGQRMVGDFCVEGVENSTP